MVGYGAVTRWRTVGSYSETVCYFSRNLVLKVIGAYFIVSHSFSVLGL